MILFTIIFFVMVLAVGAAAIFGFSFYLRRTKRLQSEKPRQFAEPSPYRPLFAPTDEELRQFAREEKSREAAKKADAARQAEEAKISRARAFEPVWERQPNRGNTIQFINLSAAGESALFFAAAAQRILQFWDDGKIDELSAQDLADLLDSHLRILPQQERASGALFRLKQEISSRRRKPEDK